MGAFVAVVFGSIVLVAIVIGLSLVTINKGYSYKHSIDPHPDEEEPNEIKEKDVYKS